MKGKYSNTIDARILIIEDDIELALTLKESLAEDGYYVDVAYNGSEGTFLHKQSPYKLIITDIVMPVMDGIEVIMWVKENSPTTKLLVVSGGGYFGSKDYLTMAKGLGADAVLSKPYQLEEIRTAVLALVH